MRLIGDLPFFVSPDSSDVWAHPEYFLLDERRRPRFVAGVPPDYFSGRGSSGATRFTIGTLLREPVTPGASIACARCWRTWTSFGWIISAHLQPLGMSRRIPLPRNRRMGCRPRRRVPHRCPGRSAAYPSLPRICGIITPDVTAARPVSPSWDRCSSIRVRRQLG